MCVFVIAYVWQNIELMKIKINYRDLVRIERELTMERDLYLIERESVLRSENLRVRVGAFGYRPVSPYDIEIIRVTGGD